MKKTLLFLFLFTLPASTLFSQAMVNIDSVKTLPANPTATDAVYLHIYGWCGYGCALSAPPTVLTAGMNHTVQACYFVNVLAVITNIHDSVYLFTGPAGVHNVIWGIVQNSDQFNPVCDTPVTNGSESVNVVTTGIDQPSQTPFAISWDAQDHSFVYSLPDKTSRTFSVYTMSGQLVRKEQTNGSSGKISLDAEASGLYLVVLEDESGFVLRKKIYCQ
jgi:hypothetical protein